MSGEELLLGEGLAGKYAGGLSDGTGSALLAFDDPDGACWLAVLALPLPDLSGRVLTLEVAPLESDCVWCDDAWAFTSAAPTVPQAVTGGRST